MDKVDAHVKRFGRTPLLWAAKNGQKGIVKLLLTMGKVDVDARDPPRRTPLSQAAENGHEGIVKLLLATGKVDVNARETWYGQTPLSWAAKNGHKRIVKLLLATGKVNVEVNDDCSLRNGDTI